MTPFFNFGIWDAEIETFIHEACYRRFSASEIKPYRENFLICSTRMVLAINQVRDWFYLDGFFLFQMVCAKEYSDFLAKEPKAITLEEVKKIRRLAFNALGKAFIEKFTQENDEVSRKRLNPILDRHTDIWVDGHDEFHALQAKMFSQTFELNLKGHDEQCAYFYQMLKKQQNDPGVVCSERLFQDIKVHLEMMDELDGYKFQQMLPFSQLDEQEFHEAMGAEDLDPAYNFGC